MAKLLQFGENILSEDVNKNADVGVNVIGNHRVEKLSERAQREEHFASIFSTWRKITRNFSMW